ncbi:type IV toxin-antitoxin system AbiEi family antitoxin [Paraburkholderia tuberum]|uniref:Transcriptional regulator, AbiEi antitoxin, Type IV TA system n=1 Tax=Paraburkholderia tuberum TaxID=157910 RepID=A0A1H1GQI1_9BURK|nr:type IV toxin-antitoxin system AbiEi family antitoxin [Paraburkholderia tuberum]SDR15343.1 hypothetical protein SAMN05445850_3019 [Paraburkholderia tuberum]
MNQLISDATRRSRVPLSVIGFRPAGRSDGLTKEGKLTLDVSGAVQQYTLAARGRIRSRAQVSVLVAKNRTAAFPVLLATAYLTLALAEECVEHDLQLIDLAGNLYVHAPGQYRLVTGRPANSEIRRLTSKSGKPAISASASALRMIFVLLSAPELLNRPYREIAAAAGVALGTVGSVLDDLREGGLLAGTDDRRLLDPAALREEWAINHLLRLLPKLNVQRFAVGDPSWWQHAELPAGQAWWGGEVAAAKLTGQLRPAAQTLYVEPSARPDVTMALAKRHRLPADPALPAHHATDNRYGKAVTTIKRLFVLYHAFLLGHLANVTRLDLRPARCEEKLLRPSKGQPDGLVGQAVAPAALHRTPAGQTNVGHSAG